MSIVKKWSYMTFFWFVLVLLVLFVPGPVADNPSPFLFPHSDKVVHFAIFAVLAGLLFHTIYVSDFVGRSRNGLRFVAFLMLVAFGLLSESVQDAWIEGRSGDLWDFIADTVGIIFGMFVSQLVIVMNKI